MGLPLAGNLLGFPADGGADGLIGWKRLQRMAKTLREAEAD
jgi:hypothetical protein